MSELDGGSDTREDGFTKLFAECYGPVLAYARRRLDEDAAQDVVAETFLTAWRHFDELSGEPLPWLYRVASHTIANQRRGSSRRERLSQRSLLLLRETVIPDHADAVAGTGQLIAAFRLLTEQDREVLRLVSWEGLDTADAASALGCSAVAFRVRLYRARHRLSRLLEAQSGERVEGTRPRVIAWKETKS